MGQCYVTTFNVMHFHLQSNLQFLLTLLAHCAHEIGLQVSLVSLGMKFMWTLLHLWDQFFRCSVLNFSTVALQYRDFRTGLTIDIVQSDVQVVFSVVTSC